jgi:hypothetical protein
VTFEGLLLGLGFWSFVVDWEVMLALPRTQGGSLMVSESRGKVGRCFPIPWPVREPVQVG